MWSFQFDKILLANYDKKDENGNKVNKTKVKDDRFQLNKEEDDKRTTTEPAQSWGKRREQLRNKREIDGRDSIEKEITQSVKARLPSDTGCQTLLCKGTCNISW